MKVLLIGGTGVISTDVCKMAIEKNYEVYILNRGRRKKSINEEANLIIADIKKDTEEYLKKKIGDIRFDIVVDFLSYNVNQLQKTLNCVKCNQYIFISSATIYDEHEDGFPYKESDAKGNRGWSYCANKYNCELVLEKIAETKGIKYTIVRPYVTYNETRFPYQIAPLEYYTIIDRIKNDLPVAICGKNTITTVTSAKDFSVGLVGLFGNPSAYNEDFHITSDKTVRWSDILEQTAAKFGKEVKVVEISKNDLVKTITEINVPEIIEDKSRNMRFDNAKIKKAVPDFHAFLEYSQCLDGICEYFSDVNHQKINYLWNGCLDRLLKDSCDISISVNQYRFNGWKSRIMYYMGRYLFIYYIYHTLKKLKAFLKIRR